MLGVLLLLFVAAWFVFSGASLLPGKLAPADAGSHHSIHTHDEEGPAGGATAHIHIGVDAHHDAPLSTACERLHIGLAESWSAGDVRALRGFTPSTLERPPKTLAA